VITPKQLDVLEKMADGHPLYINLDVPKPYALVGETMGDPALVSIRTVRALLEKHFVEKVPTTATGGSLEYRLSAIGMEELGLNQRADDE